MSTSTAEATLNPEPPEMSADGYRAVLSRPHFRNLYLGEVVSLLGDWFNTVAVYTLVQAATDRAAAVSAVLVVRTLPTFLVSPIAGPLVDRFDRRTLLLVADVARAVAVLGLLMAYRSQSLPLVYGALTLLMVFTGLAIPAKNATVPMVVGPGQLSAANALAGGSWSVMLALGAALGGVVTEALGVQAALLVDAATYLVSFAFLSRLPRLLPPAETAESKARAGFKAGIGYLWRTPKVAALVALKPLLALPMAAVALIPLFGKAYGGAAAAAGFTGALFAARGLGALVGALGPRTFVPDSAAGLRRAVVVGFLTMAVAYLAASTAESFVGVAFGFAVAAMGSGTVWVFSGTLLQREADGAFHGRVFATELGIMTLVISGTSMLVGGAVDAGFTLSQVLAGAGAAAGVAATLAAAGNLRR
ncbi:MAG: MFS transporter [Myxococcales bacterium]|nr:MFS transporter [Myxococcales bacterium]